MLTWESMEKRKQRTHATSKYLVQYMCRACCGVRGSVVFRSNTIRFHKRNGWEAVTSLFRMPSIWKENFQVVQPIGPLFGSEAVGKQMPSSNIRSRVDVRPDFIMIVDTASQITFLGEVSFINYYQTYVQRVYPI